MAFKRKSAKAKKPKKSSKKGKDNEWNFEGGVTYDNISKEDPKEYKRIHTQERDETRRRGRLKIEDRKRKQYFVDKMSKRVKFSDVWKPSSSEEAEKSSNGHHANLDETKENEDNNHSQNPNPLPVLDRLQFFLQNSLTQSSTKDFEEKSSDRRETVHANEDDDEDEDDDVAAVNGKNHQSLLQEKSVNREFLVFSNNELKKVHHREDVDVENLHGDSDDELDENKESSAHLHEIENPYLQWFFDSRIILDREKQEVLKQLSSRNKPQQVATISLPCTTEEKITIYEAANKTRPQHHIGELETVQSVPSVYKLWKYSSPPSPLNTFSKELLPKLLTYSDIFIEGRSYVNDKMILETLLMHGVFHVVRSRAVVVKHNQKLKQRENLQKKRFGLTDELDLDKIADAVRQPEKSAKKKRKEKRQQQLAENNRLSANSTHEYKDRIDLAEPEEEDLKEEAMKDQGFVRPRLLILTPLRCTAKRIVHMILRILGENSSVSNLEKFNDEYSDLESTDADDNESIDYAERYHSGQQQGESGGRRQPGEKPEDWKALFRGNIDDDFKLGIQINPGHGKGNGATKGVHVRLFSDFYISDIIIASPIGLKLLLDSPSNTYNKHSTHSNNIDFLTSIEQVILHQLDVLSFQNMEHVYDIFQIMNQLPKENHELTDYSRVRPYFINGLAPYYRQLMITSAFNTPDLQSFFRQYATSKSGWIRCKKLWNKDGVIANVIVPKVKQIFQIIPYHSSSSSFPSDGTNTSSSSFHSCEEEYEERKFHYFKEKILNKILSLKQSRVLIVVPSYFDFIKIRNDFLKEEINAVFISEYSRESEISRGRSRFYQGIKDILVYSGRAHFYRRFRIRGAKHVIFYSLPEYPHLYSEIVNMLGDFRPAIANDGEEEKETAEAAAAMAAVQDILNTDEEFTSLTLCSELDQMALERVVGKKRCDHMIQSKKTTFLFF